MKRLPELWRKRWIVEIALFVLFFVYVMVNFALDGTLGEAGLGVLPHPALRRRGGLSHLYRAKHSSD